MVMNGNLLIQAGQQLYGNRIHQKHHYQKQVGNDKYMKTNITLINFYAQVPLGRFVV